MRRLLSLAFILCCAASARAADVYIAQVASGGATGLSCSSPLAASYFNNVANWSLTPTGVQIGPDVTVHACGTFTGLANTTMLTFQGSGTSGHPVTLLFESGANFTAPYWSLNGAINTNGKAFVTINGGTNGIVQNTANGTNLANQVGSRGIVASGSNNLIIRNLTVANICVHVAPASGGCVTSGNDADAIYVSGGNNVLITGNTVHDSHWNIFFLYPGSSTTTNATISNNTSYNTDHAIAVGDGNSSAILSGIVISGNIMHDMVNWDNTANNYHHDYVHIFTANGSSSITGLQFYNNVMYGDPGANLTALVNLENNAGNTFDGAKVYNNFITNSSSTHLPPFGYISSGGTNHSMLNNTIVGSSTSESVANICFFAGGTGYTFKNNSCQNVGSFIYWRTATPSLAGAGASDYNDWFQAGDAFVINNGTRITFSAWQTLCSCDAHSIQLNPNVQTVSPFQPNAGSPLINAAINLTSLAITALNSDINGSGRPSSGSWTIGAANFGGSVISIPSVPTGLSATPSGSTINISWAASTGTPAGYLLSRGTVSGGPYTQIANVTTGTSYANTGLSAGTYYYVVSAYNSAGTSANSVQASAIIAATSPAATLTPASVNLGTFVLGVTSPTQIVTLTNTGTATLSSIAVASPSGPNAADFLVSANGCGATLAISASCTFAVSFTPSISGAESASVVVTSNDPFSPDTVSLSGTGVSAVNISPLSISFGNVYTNRASAAQVVTYINNSGASVTFSSVAISGGDSSQFAISSNTCSGTLANGSQCTIGITFNPTSNGNKASSLVITDSAIGSPHSVSLTGKATGRKILRVGAAVGYHAWLKPQLIKT